MEQYVTLYKYYGAWRSLVAHYTGGVGVVGSNPAAPTINLKEKLISYIYRKDSKSTQSG